MRQLLLGWIAVAAVCVSVSEVYAKIPELREYEQVKMLAFQIQNDSNTAFQQARSYSPFPSLPEQNALNALYRFHLTAVQFARITQLNPTLPANTEQAMITLSADFDEAQKNFPMLVGYSAMKGIFGHLTRSVNQMRQAYGISFPGVPGGWDAQEAMRLTSEALQLTMQTRFLAQREVFNPWQREAVVRLQELETAMLYFHDQIRIFPDGPTFSQDMFNRSVFAFRVARDAMARATFSPQVFVAFNRVMESFRYVGSFYGATP